VGSNDFHKAAYFATLSATGIRSGGALHVAIASLHGAAIATLDKRLAGSAAMLKVRAQLI
jgi:predicted nucleic acid-binding protein